MAAILATGATRKQLCLVLGCTGAAVDNATRSGCPRRTDGRYDLPAVIAWRQQRAVEQAAGARTDSAAMERWREARADREELALRRARVELIPRDEVESRTVLQILAVRQALNDMVRKLASRLHNAPTPEAIEVELQAEVDHIHEGFAEGLERIPERAGAGAPE